MIQDDDEPTAEELEAAEALARALDRGHAAPATPDDALETAALLRYSKDGGALDEGRAAALFEDAMSRARAPKARSRTRFWLFGVLGLAAAGAASLVLVNRAEAPASAALLPAPPRRLLDAELEAAGTRTASLDALSTETAEYRALVYSRLKERYGR
jgi:hypothetical protein